MHICFSCGSAELGTRTGIAGRDGELILFSVYVLSLVPLVVLMLWEEYVTIPASDASTSYSAGPPVGPSPWGGHATMGPVVKLKLGIILPVMLYLYALSLIAFSWMGSRVLLPWWKGRLTHGVQPTELPACKAARIARTLFAASE